MRLVSTICLWMLFPGGHPLHGSLLFGQEDGNLTDEMLEELLFGEESTEVVEEKPSQLWSKTLNLSFGGGHSDNPLQGPHVQTEAGFATASLDAFLLRMGKNSGVFYVYLYSEGAYYSGIPVLDLTGIALAQAEYSSTSPTTGLGRGIRLRHTYYDMVFDMSENLDFPYSFTVQSNKSEIRPFVSYPLGENLTGGLELAAARDVYAMDSEDYSEKEFRTLLKWRGERETSLNLYMYSRWKNYDERLRREASGFPFPEGTLETRTVGLGVSGGRTFGDKEDWEVSLSTYVNKTTDNAGGYYDYTSLSGRLEVSHEIGPWTLSASVGASGYDYNAREIASGDLFERNGLTMELAIDRKIDEKWNLFAKWNKERDDSNDPSYEYVTNVFSAGVKWSN